MRLMCLLITPKLRSQGRNEWRLWDSMDDFFESSRRNGGLSNSGKNSIVSVLASTGFRKQMKHFCSLWYIIKNIIMKKSTHFIYTPFHFHSFSFTPLSIFTPLHFHPFSFLAPFICTPFHFQFFSLAPLLHKTTLCKWYCDSPNFISLMQKTQTHSCLK